MDSRLAVSSYALPHRVAATVTRALLGIRAKTIKTTA
jgi:hypothetical protein